MGKSKKDIIPVTRVRFVYYDEDGNVYHTIQRYMNAVPNVGEEIFLDTGDSNIDMDGWIIKSRICDLYHNWWELTIKHRLDDVNKVIWRFKEEK